MERETAIDYELYDAVWSRFEKSLDLAVAPNARWQYLLSGIQELLENFDAEPYINGASLDTEVKDFTAWMQSHINEAKGLEKTKAFWLPIKEFVSDDASPIYALGISWCKQYNEENNFWVKEKIGGIPDSAYLITDTLDVIMPLVEKDANQQILDWILPIAAYAYIMDAAIAKLDTTTLLKNKAYVSVGIGYEDGDYIGLREIGIKKGEV